MREDASRQRLTAEQERVLLLARQGLSDRAIAEAMGLGLNDLDGHWARILRCLGVRTRQAAVIADLGTASESESDLYVRAFRASPAAIAITRLRDGVFVEVNAAAEEVLLYPHNEIVGRSSFDIDLWVRPEERTRLVQSLREHRSVRNEEFLFRRKDGETIVCRYSAELAVIGGEECIFAVVADITERKRDEEVLRQRAEELAALNSLSAAVNATLSFDQTIEAALVGVVDVVQPDLALLFINEEDALVLKAVAPESGRARLADMPDHRIGECLCGLSLRERHPMYSLDIFSDLRCTWEECKRAGMSSFAALPLIKGDEAIGVMGLASQTLRDFERHASFLETVAGQVTSALANARLYEKAQTELARREKAEEELRGARDELEKGIVERTQQLAAANAELEAFSYSVSHDLKAPLRSMDGFSRILLNDYAAKLDDEGIDCLNRICAAALRMGKLVDEMLELSRAMRGQFRVEKVNLSAMAEEVARELRDSAPDRQALFRIEPNLEAVGDRDLLRSLLGNLLDNAWKYTSKNEAAQIEFFGVERCGRWEYSVRDDGVGFDQAYAGNLFRPFQRLHGADEYPGTGVGLATAQRIVSRHGGEIWATGAVDQGATFTFALSPRRE